MLNISLTEIDKALHFIQEAIDRQDQPPKNKGKKSHKAIKNFKENIAKRTEYLIKYKMTLQQNSLRVFESIDNLEKISLRVLGN